MSTSFTKVISGDHQACDVSYLLSFISRSVCVNSSSMEEDSLLLALLLIMIQLEQLSAEVLVLQPAAAYSLNFSLLSIHSPAQALYNYVTCSILHSILLRSHAITTVWSVPTSSMETAMPRYLRPAVIPTSTMVSYGQAQSPLAGFTVITRSNLQWLLGLLWYGFKVCMLHIRGINWQLFIDPRYSAMYITSRFRSSRQISHWSSTLFVSFKNRTGLERIVRTLIINMRTMELHPLSSRVAVQIFMFSVYYEICRYLAG
jgi:hypothetical protein